MKTFTGVIILVVVASVLAGILWWFASTRDTAKTVSEDLAAYDTFDLTPTCNANSDSDWDDCCVDSCNDFCDEHNQNYFNHFANNNLCTCWCE